MNLAETPIEYDPRAIPVTGMEGVGSFGTNPNAATLVRVPGPTFNLYSHGVGQTRLTAPSLYPATGIDVTGEVVVHQDVLAPLERARAQVREAGFTLAVVSGFSTPTQAQRIFVELSKRLLALFREQKNKYPSTVDEMRIYRLAASIGTPALLSDRHTREITALRRGIMNENFSGLIEPGKDRLILAHELLRYRGNVRKYSDRYTENICAPIIHTAVGKENFGRTLQCVLTSEDNQTRALNMGIGIDIPYPSLQAPNAFENITLDGLRILVSDNKLTHEYFTECAEPPNGNTLRGIVGRRRVLYHAMTNAGFVPENRQGRFTLPAEPGDLPPRHIMFNKGLEFGHKW